MKNTITALRLREEMERKHITAQELSNITQIHKASISQYYNGSHRPSNITAGKLAEFFNVNPLWLMGFDVDREAEIARDIPKYAQGTAELIDLYSHLTTDQQNAILNLLRSIRNL